MCKHSFGANFFLTFLTSNKVTVVFVFYLKSLLWVSAKDSIKTMLPIFLIKNTIKVLFKEKIEQNLVNVLKITKQISR